MGVLTVNFRTRTAGGPNREKRQFMGGIIDEMIRGYAKGYLFGQMVVGCFFLLLFAVFLGALLVLLVTSYLQGGH